MPTLSSTLPSSEFGADADHYLRRCSLHRGLAKATTTAIATSLRMLATFAGTTEIAGLDEPALRSFFGDGTARRRWTAWRYRNHWKYLKGFYDWCVETGRSRSNPILGIERPRTPHLLPRRLSRADAEKLLASGFNYPWGTTLQQLRNYAILAAFLYTGLRVQELLGLRRDDVDLEAGTILVRSGKGAKDRLVPVFCRLAPVLEAYWAERSRRGVGSPFAFSSLRSPAPLTYQNLRTMLGEVAFRAGVRFTPHQLRHTFASEALENGLDLYKLKEILGHSSPATTAIYLQLTPQGLRRSLDQVKMY
jgi:site-specific recombinase XerD